jgi:hypothetical protein
LLRWEPTAALTLFVGNLCPLPPTLPLGPPHAHCHTYPTPWPVPPHLLPHLPFPLAYCTPRLLPYPSYPLAYPTSTVTPTLFVGNPCPLPHLSYSLVIHTHCHAYSLPHAHCHTYPTPWESMPIATSLGIHIHCQAYPAAATPTLTPFQHFTLPLERYTHCHAYPSPLESTPTTYPTPSMLTMHTYPTPWKCMPTASPTLPLGSHTHCHTPFCGVVITMHAFM